MKIGYVRVSSIDQKVDRQIEGLELEGIKVEKMFIDYASGANKERPKLQEMLEFVREGDEVIVSSVDRLGRSQIDLINILSSLKSKKVTVHFLKENLKISEIGNSRDDLMFGMVSIFAEFERAIIKERQLEGIAIARAKGIYKGRQHTLSKYHVGILKNMYMRGESIHNICKTFGLTPPTVYSYLKPFRSQIGYRSPGFTAKP